MSGTQVYWLIVAALLVAIVLGGWLAISVH
jgi:hypothetical protein